MLLQSHPEGLVCLRPSEATFLPRAGESLAVTQFPDFRPVASVISPDTHCCFPTKTLKDETDLLIFRDPILVPSQLCNAFKSCRRILELSRKMYVFNQNVLPCDSEQVTESFCLFQFPYVRKGEIILLNPFG